MGKFLYIVEYELYENLNSLPPFHFCYKSALKVDHFSWQYVSCGVFMFQVPSLFYRVLTSVSISQPV